MSDRSCLGQCGMRLRFQEIQLPAELRGLLEPGARAYRFGECLVIVGHSADGWHLSVSHPHRYPTWDEIKAARYALTPHSVTMALILPPPEEYVNVHENCFHLWEIEAPQARRIVVAR